MPKAAIAALSALLLTGGVLAQAPETAEFQRRIDELSAAGGGTLVIGAGEHRSGALFFKPGVNLRLEEGATLIGTDDAADYPKCETRIEGQTRHYYPALVNAIGCDGFTISGKGTIDGHGLEVWKEFWKGYEQAKREKRAWSNVENDLVRPRLLFVSRSRNVEVSGVTFKNSKFWTTHYHQCENVFVHDCTIKAEILEGVRGPSTDAIDLDGVSHAVISNVTMDVNDDAVVLKGGKGRNADDFAANPGNGENRDILVVGCKFMSTCHHCLTLGSECVRGDGVTMRNCRVEGAGALLYLKLRSDTPQRYSNIRVERVSGRVKDVFRMKPWKQWFIGEAEEAKRSFVDGVVLQELDLKYERFSDIVYSSDYEARGLEIR